MITRPDILKIILWGVWTLSLPASILSQIHTSVFLSKDTVEMGDPVRVGIHISVPVDYDPDYISLESWASMVNTLYPTDSARLEPFADLEILDGGQWSVTDVTKKIPFDTQKFTLKNGQWIAELNLEMAIYNAGQFVINGPKVHSDSIILTGTSDTAWLTVLWPEAVSITDSLALEPIKDIFTEPAHWSDYTIYLLLLFAAVVLLYLLYRFRKQRSLHKLTEITKPEIRRPAHDIALEALRALNEKRLWQQGHIKLYQSELTEIIRQYLDDRYGIPAQKMITEDIILATTQVNMADIHKTTLRQILNVADLVKFARARPDENIHADFMEMAVQFVRNTRSLTDVHEENNPE